MKCLHKPCKKNIENKYSNYCSNKCQSAAEKRRKTLKIPNFFLERGEISYQGNK